MLLHRGTRISIEKNTLAQCFLLNHCHETIHCNDPLVCHLATVLDWSVMAVHFFGEWVIDLGIPSNVRTPLLLPPTRKLWRVNAQYANNKTNEQTTTCVERC
jgi:hypothetical protein